MTTNDKSGASDIDVAQWIEEIEADLKNSTIKNPDNSYMTEQSVIGSAQAMLNLLRKIEAGELAVVPVDATDDMAETACFAAGVCGGIFESIYSLAIKASPQAAILNELRGENANTL